MGRFTYSEIPLFSWSGQIPRKLGNEPMAAQGYKRKLSAILSADGKGYGRLIGEDEVATVRTLKDYRALISTPVGEYRGRVVDAPGDNEVSEFGSVVDAVESAVRIQEELGSSYPQSVGWSASLRYVPSPAFESLITKPDGAAR